MTLDKKNTKLEYDEQLQMHINKKTVGRSESNENKRKALQMGKIPRKVPYPADDEVPYRYVDPVTGEKPFGFFKYPE